MVNITTLPTPAYGGGTAPQKMALDNLIRRELKVGDPNDPSQVAKALLERYQADARARAIDQEAQGMPFLQASSRFVPAAAPHTATSIDCDQARDDVNKDLQELLSSNLLKDVGAELEGWADGIRSSVNEALDSARFGLDPRQRDRAFGLRRTLGDYARLARLVGALSPTVVGPCYRSLARSIDEACAVVLVLIGESMANNGFQGGRYLLQAPYSELQTRRDAAMHALRNLLTSLSFTNEQNDWPRGIDAYRRLFDALEAQGQGDLRALMTEQELGRVLDLLVRRASEGTARGLRAIGSTAQIDLQRFYRLINFGYRLVDPESPPLTTFLESLRLFADGFTSSGGHRLLRIARPPIVFYGLYTQDEEEAADRRLTQLTIYRGRLASQLDCMASCNCTTEGALMQVVLDTVLYDLDRAIDLYAVGNDELGLPELRASAYSYLVDELLDHSHVPVDVTLVPTLRMIQGLLRPHPLGFAAAEWTLTPAIYDERRTKNLPVGGSVFKHGDVLHQELCMHLEAERRWEDLVRQMAPGCIAPEQLFGDDGDIMTLIGHAMDIAGTDVTGLDADCNTQGPDIPPHFETALASIAYNTGSAGSGR
jgi:hypothetical protein